MLLVAAPQNLMATETTSLPIDVIIPTRNRGQRVIGLLKSLSLGNHQSFTAWVVDQSDNHLTEMAVKHFQKQDSRVRYIKSKFLGSNYAREEGILASNSEFIALSDDDCRADADWLTNIITELSNPNCDVVFGRVIGETGSFSEQDLIDWSYQARLVGLSLATKNQKRRQIYYGNRFNLGFGHSNNMGIKRVAWQNVGGFDVMLGAGAPFRSWPERDFGYRILKYGGQIVYSPRPLVYHHHSGTRKQMLKTLTHYGYGTGAAVGKFMRSGDIRSFYLIVEWMIDQGLRQIVSGALKWASWEKIMTGVFQLLVPWVGLLHSWRYPIDRKNVLFIPPSQLRSVNYNELD